MPLTLSLCLQPERLLRRCGTRFLKKNLMVFLSLLFALCQYVNVRLLYIAKHLDKRSAKQTGGKERTSETAFPESCGIPPKRSCSSRTFRYGYLVTT